MMRLLIRHPPIPTLFPYTTLFRSRSWQGWEDYVAFLYRTGSITEHTQVWWSVRPHLAFPTVEIGLARSEEHTSELQSHSDLVCRLLLEKKNVFGIDDIGILTPLLH